ncbi:MAG: hypothetical protein FJ318_02420 [SAR202 cluster bacterium]|nr:hypothetical protein [SAR202 cluster bacterium]
MARRARPLLIGLLVLLSLLGGAGAAFAQRASSDVRIVLPIRAIELDVAKADLALQVVNTTPERRTVSFEFTNVPQGWDVAVWNNIFDFRLKQIAIEPATTAGPTGQDVRLRIQPPGGVRPGTYIFHMAVKSPDGAVTYDAFPLTITVKAPPEVQDLGVTVAAQFPVLSGPPTSQFEFEIAIRNQTGAAQSFDLSAEVPQTWQVQFKPSFEEKIINTTSVLKDATQRVVVRVTPNQRASAGTYQIPVTVNNPANEAHRQVINLTVNVTGQGQLTTTTPTGQLNMESTAGKGTSGTFRLINFGTADLTGIALAADAPTDWKVQYQIDRVDLPQNQQVDIPVTITPPENAIPGDYIVTLRASHPDTTGSIDMRVTVAQSTIWGWLGIVLVIVVLGSIGALFLRLGRR